MPPLTAIERFFERLFERPSARLFRTRLQPLQLQRRIERAMEAERRVTLERTLVPNRFVVHLHPDDLAGFGDLTETLAVELADGALTFARAHHFSLADRPRVDLQADARVQRADIRVEAKFADSPPERFAGPEPASGEPESPSSATATSPGVHTDPTATRVFRLPQSTSPRAAVAVTDPDGRIRRFAIGGGGLTIGRADDNDLVARDTRVSRHHGRISGRRGTLVYLDLGSTNGSRVNGEPVTEVVLGVGDRLELGATTIVVEGAGAPD
ncbi:MAG: FhaA domain-containing protein [Candidatus Limnocylindrales bacterium]